MGKLEARKLKYANTETEALLMGILVEETSLAAKFLWSNGVTILKVREEIVKLLGKGDMYFFSPERPPLSEAAPRAINWAIDRKLNSGDSGKLQQVICFLAFGHKRIVQVTKYWLPFASMMTKPKTWNLWALNLGLYMTNTCLHI